MTRNSIRSQDLPKKYLHSFADPLADPSKVTDPKGRGDPMILINRKKKFYLTPWFWGAAGLVIAGAVAGGIAASMGGSEDGGGRVNVRFR